MALTDGNIAYWNLDDNGSGGVSLLDSTYTGGNTLTNNGGVTLGTGIVGGDAVFSGSQSLSTANTLIPPPSGAFSISLWYYATGVGGVLASSATSGANSFLVQDYSGVTYVQIQNNGSLIAEFDASTIIGSWTHYAFTYDASGNGVWYQNGTPVDSKNAAGIGTDPAGGFQMGIRWDGYSLIGQLDEVGVWDRSLTQAEVTTLYTNPSALNPYPPGPLYYNNTQNDGDWGNLLNWWKDSGFTIQATALPTSLTPVNLYNQVTQNTQGANQCFCADANFWSADFGAGLTLQSTGVVNMQGSSVMAGSTTDSVSMHDSSQLTSTSVVDGNVTMRDSSRAFGSILGNATIYYDGGNGQFPIGGTVAGSVTYLGWPALSPQWFNDTISLGGAGDGDWNNPLNWWTSNSYTTRPINAEGTQELPDASTDVFIGDNINLNFNTGPSITVNTITGSSSGLGYNTGNLTLTVTNGVFLSNNSVMARVTLYGNVTFDTGAFVFQSVINGTATYKSAASLQYSWQGSANSLGNLNEGASYGSTGFVVNISGGGGGGGTALGTNWISRLLHLPWFINV